MQFSWNTAQGAPRYDRQNGFGFVTGAVYNADAALRIPETNSGFLPLWWYAGTPLTDAALTPNGVTAVPTDAVRADDLKDRCLPVWFRVDVPAEGVYKAEITVAGTGGGDVLVFTGRRRLVRRGELDAGEQKTVVTYCDVFPIVPRGQTDAVASTAVNIAVVGGALVEVKLTDAPDTRRIWVCGDSTVTDQTAELPYAPGTSYAGWGQMLPAYLPDVCVTNHAHSGLTTESFRSEGHWAIVRPRLRAGDACLFQFGHNDQKLAHLQARGGYTDRLRTFIKETRAAGAMPVLVTPLARNSWKDPAHYNDLLADFADAVFALGKAENVPVLDLHGYALELVKQDGLETAKRWFYPGDFTHTNDYGAYTMADFVAHELGCEIDMDVYIRRSWTPAPPFAPLTPPADCAIPAPDGDPFAAYDADRPADPLTRAEALELAIKALKLFPINVYNDLYNDVVGHETYAGTVQCAAQNDLIPDEWVADGSLYPARTVTAADFLAVLMPGAAGRRPIADPAPVPDAVPPYARRAAGQAVAEALTAPETLNDPLTRRDAAAICRRLHI
ncbi:rhamnogalacturonan acetylesterase [Gemmiger sp.]